MVVVAQVVAGGGSCGGEVLGWKRNEDRKRKEKMRRKEMVIYGMTSEAEEKLREKNVKGKGEKSKGMRKWRRGRKMEKRG